MRRSGSVLDLRVEPEEKATRGEAKRMAKVNAVEFLRAALADGGMLVTELEARARVAGLLKSGQPISQCKPVRDAKRKLGVRSGRSGFGRGARYYWRLAVPPPVHG